MRVITLLFIFSIMAACIEIDEPACCLPTETYKAGFDFTMVANNLDNPPLINSINPPSDINAQHWTFKSPSHMDQEVGFTLVTSKTFVEGNNKVIVFLHGNGGSEGSGFANYIPYLTGQSKMDDATVYVMLNGMTVNGTGSWNIKPQFDYFPVNTIRECIEGMITSSLFTFLSSDPTDWKLHGFSMGGRAAMSVAMDPINLNWEHMPHQIYPMGSWLSTDNLNGMIDFDSALVLIDDYLPQQMELNVVTHVLDRGGNEATLKISQTDPFVDNMRNQGFTIGHLRPTPPRNGCDVNSEQVDSCNVHNLSFYFRLNNPLDTSQTIGDFVLDF